MGTNNPAKLIFTAAFSSGIVIAAEKKWVKVCRFPPFSAFEFPRSALEEEKHRQLLTQTKAALESAHQLFLAQTQNPDEPESKISHLNWRQVLLTRGSKRKWT